MIPIFFNFNFLKNEKLTREGPFTEFSFVRNFSFYVCRFFPNQKMETNLLACRCFQQVTTFCHSSLYRRDWHWAERDERARTFPLQKDFCIILVLWMSCIFRKKQQSFHQPVFPLRMYHHTFDIEQNEMSLREGFLYRKTSGRSSRSCVSLFSITDNFLSSFFLKVVYQIVDI